MKFSILTLLGATGYAALVFAAIREPDSWWRYASILAWLAILAYAVMLATDAHRKDTAVFGRVFVGCLAAYLLLTFLPVSMSPTTTNRPDLLPHHWLAMWLSQESLQVQPPAAPAATPAYGPQPWPRPSTVTFGGTFSYQIAEKPNKTIEAVAALNVALIFGLIAGVCAFWRHRRNERQHTS